MPTDPEFHRLPKKKKAYIIHQKFMMDDTKSSIKYSIGGLSDSELYTYVSEDALVWLKQNMPEVVSPNGIRHQGAYSKNIRIEHAVPSKLVYDYLQQLKGMGKLTEKSIEDLLDGTLICALITAEEDARLNKLGLNHKMPDGKPFTECEPLCRYKAADIKIHKFQG